MPFDALAMAAIADEIRTAAGSQIQRIIQPSQTSVALQVYGHGLQRWLVLSADPRFARVCFSTDKLAKAFATPSPFVMLLRKHLESTRIAAVEQVREERILQIACGPPAYETRLVAEVMGKHSNVLLLDGDDRILGAIKSVPPRQSRVRPIMPGNQYRLPPSRERDGSLFPPGPRLDPIADADELAHLLEHHVHGQGRARQEASVCEVVPATTEIDQARAPAASMGGGQPDANVREILLGILPGCSPFLADQIAWRAGLEPNAPVGEVSVNAVMDAAQGLYALYGTHAWQPHVFKSSRGRLDFCPFQPVNVDEARSVLSTSEAVDLCMGGEESRDSLGSVRKGLLGEIERAQRAVERKIASLQEGLEATRDSETWMQNGQLILAYSYSIERGDAELRIPELEVTIPLNPRLSPQENAERSFRRYGKLRDAAARIPGLLQEARAEGDRLNDLAVFARLADSEGALRDLARELPGAVRESPKKGGKGEKRRGPLRFRWNGYVILVGRNARENEEVTFRLAHRDDLWLHARQRTGAHVILQGAGSQAADEATARAAAVAAYYSEARTDTAVDVEVAAVRDVRKIPGGPPGRVTYRNARTIRAQPGLSDWQPDKGR